MLNHKYGLKYNVRYS